MSTSTTTTASNVFNPLAMAQYNSFQPQIQTQLQNNINNPWSAMGGNQQFANMNEANQAQYGANMGNSISSALARGIQPNSPLLASMINKNASQYSGATSSGYSNLWQQAANFRQGSANAAAGYSPLATGGTQKQSAGGLGQWIGVATAAIQAGGQMGAAAFA